MFTLNKDSGREKSSETEYGNLSDSSNVDKFLFVKSNFNLKDEYFLKVQTLYSFAFCY